MVGFFLENILTESFSLHQCDSVEKFSRKTYDISVSFFYITSLELKLTLLLLFHLLLKLTQRVTYLVDLLQCQELAKKFCFS